MSLQSKDEYLIPEETRRVARAAFPKGTLCLRIADALGTIYRDQQFAELFACRGQPAASPARLALATVLQFVDGLSDRQAAEAVRGRIDWKYALALELTDPGFDHTVLSEFRSRLVSGQAELRLLDTLLDRLRALKLLKPRGRQRTDSTHVLAAVRTLNRLERVGETMRAALDSLAVVVPDWLRTQTPPEWYERYGRRVENDRLPKTEAARQELAALIGADGQKLLQAIDAAADQPWLREVPALATHQIVLASKNLCVIQGFRPFGRRRRKDGWDRNDWGKNLRRYGGAPSRAEQEATRGTFASGGDDAGGTEREPDGFGGIVAAGGGTAGHALPMDQPDPGQ